MKSLLLCLLFLSWNMILHAQNKNIDSLNRLIASSKSDTQRVNLKVKILGVLSNGNIDSAIAYGNEVINEAKQINYLQGEVLARIRISGNYCYSGNYAKARDNLDIAKGILTHFPDSLSLGKMYASYGMMYSMQNKFDTAHIFYKKGLDIAHLHHDNSMVSSINQNNAIAYQQESNYGQALSSFQDALKAAEEASDLNMEAYIYLNIAITYTTLDEKKRAEESYLKSVELAKQLNLQNVLAYAYSNLSSLYSDLKRYDKQYEYGIKAGALGHELGDKGIEASSLSRAALALALQNRFEEAAQLNQRARIIADSSNQPLNTFQAYSDMGSILTMQNKYSEAIPYFEKAFHSINESDIYDVEVGRSYTDLSTCYEKTGDFKKALATYKITASISDSIRGKDNIKKATELTLNYEFDKKQQIDKDEQQKKNDLTWAKQTALIIGLVLTFLLAAVAFYGFRNKRRANVLLQQQKEKMELTLSELKSTQAQLIQSEKMASLGELTAGIAHEIQNPLNFVNNFSEVSNELIDEMNAELESGDIEQARAIALDVKQNLTKINHHGKRADAIVKGMLQHSRSSTGQKEATDINALCDEYMRLSYHGLRAKDHTFNATLKTNFDNTIGKINIIPQDLGRVIMNLLTNAFYAVNEKKQERPQGYDPTVSISTKKSNNKVEIVVSDNGNGIPQKLLDKIYQPFFTTKPTGQGTGLGLSMSYDIVTKSHGGELKVDTKENEGTTFSIILSV